MTSFKTKKLSIETLGEYLRDARMNMRLSPEQVCRLTQIPARALQNLEQGEYAELPADVYVKGFLKSLAAVYEVEPEILMEQYQTEKRVDQSLNIKDTGSARFGSKLVVTPKTLTIGIAGLLGLAVVGYLIWQVSSVASPPQLEVFSPAADTSTQSRSLLLRGRTEPGARVYVNAQEVLVEESGEFTEVLNLTDGTNNILIRAQNRFDNTTEVSRVIVVLGNPETPTAFVPSQDEPIVIEVIIAPEEAWISVTTDGIVAQSGVLASGTQNIFSAEEELLLTTGNAGSTRVIYNGQDLGVLGGPGEVLTNIRFTP